MRQTTGNPKQSLRKGEKMITLGIILLIVSLFAKIAILQSIGVLLIIVGVVLFLLGSMVILVAASF
jgi:membrane-bound ClpP family serine protease